MPKFRTRQGAMMARKPHWLCEGCGAVFTVKKPGLCTHCQHEDRNYLYFPSKKEYQRYQELVVMELAGLIDKDTIELQPRYDIHVKDLKFLCTFDFRYQKHGRYIIEDVKNTASDTGMSKMKRALAEQEYDIEVILV